MYSLGGYNVITVGAPPCSSYNSCEKLYCIVIYMWLVSGGSVNIQPVCGTWNWGNWSPSYGNKKMWHHRDDRKENFDGTPLPEPSFKIFGSMVIPVAKWETHVKRVKSGTCGATTAMSGLFTIHWVGCISRPPRDLTINGWVLWKLTPNLSSFQSWQRIKKILEGRRKAQTCLKHLDGCCISSWPLHQSVGPWTMEHVES